MNISFKVLIVVFLTFFASIISATIINVPGDQPTIQAGINVTVNGDTVLVQPGTYVENINYNGKNITVASLYLITQDTIYISQTIIDGNQNGSVVTFESGEYPISVLTGFTVINGNGTEYSNYTCGGGIFCNDNSSPSFKNITIINNSAVRGGGIYCDNSSPILQNVTISGNSADSGGGICCYINSNPSLDKVTISDNSAIQCGGGVFCYDNSSPSLDKVTISGNTATDAGGGIYCWYSYPSLINSILWNDSPQEIWVSFCSVTVTYSDIESGWTGTGNIDSDPLFVGAANGDYHLTENSPCIDAGDPASPFDPDGTIADMGAFYYDQGSNVDDNVIVQIPDIHLYQNYPNPFNPTTTIRYQLPENGEVNLSIYNIKGQKTKTIVNEKLEQGLHQIIWDGKNDNSHYVASGVYFYKLKVNNKNIAIKKCLLLK